MLSAMKWGWETLPGGADWYGTSLLSRKITEAGCVTEAAISKSSAPG